MLNRTTKLHSFVESAVTAVGCELVVCELSMPGKRSLLRVLIDKEGGVTADDCAKASRQIASVLDVEDPITGAYDLEVSSPGLDRPLYTKEHYQRFTGQSIKIRLRMPQENQRQFTGVLSAVVDDKIALETKEGPRLFALSEIEKANCVPDLRVKS